ncbi:hypothetical protein QYM36_002377 [Artemia franciscana]|uniref:DDE Tnp4 domain-containing protein n=1 Tax=Artemia franciscana TaxID=6661 RepID=A0AA88ILM3_ARTSF|nr:hypothetical protein QYM36_002377 [Artemia franciscana]
MVAGETLQSLALVKVTISSRAPWIMLKLYKALVWPVIAYEMTVASPVNKDDITALEFNRGTVEVLLKKIGPRLLQLALNDEPDIPPMKRILLTLGILATTESYRSVQYDHIIGDSAFPLSMMLLTPYHDTGNLTSVKQTHNFKHSLTRMAIEWAFSHLKGRFRWLKHFDSPDLEFSVKAIMACCVHHDICVDQNDLLPADVEFSGHTGDFTTTVPQPDAGGKVKRDVIAASLNACSNACLIILIKLF